MNCIRTSITCAATVFCLHLPAPAFAQLQPADPPKSSGLSRMFQTTIDDFRRLPSKDTLTWLSIGGGIAAAGEVLGDPEGLACARYGGAPGVTYLIRPDQHVAARFAQYDPGALRRALARATLRGAA